MNFKENIIVLMSGGLFGFAFYQYARGYRPINGGDPMRTKSFGVAMGVRG